MPAISVFNLFSCIFRVVDQVIVSFLAVIEFEALQEKCQDYYEKVSVLFCICFSSCWANSS